MQDYADYANQLVEQIDSGELDPAEVDIRPFVENESDVLTPALRDRLEGSGKLEDYNRRVRERQERELREEQVDKREQHREALDAIREPREEGTNTVELGNIEFTVKNYLNGKIERKMAKLQAAEGKGDIDLARETTIDVIMWLIDDARYIGDGKPPDGIGDWQTPEFWRDYAEDYGTQELQVEALRLSQPYRERQQELSDVDSFRGE